ncbi:MAG: hypothetical protein ACREOK_07875 [Gemmatimonadaceae bacterium]
MRLAALGGLLGSVATCDGPTEPIRYPTVQLRSLSISDDAVLKDSGLLVVAAAPQDTTRVLTPNERLKLDLTTSTGDAESFELGPIVCDDYQMACHYLDVLMKDGRHVKELFALLNVVPARVEQASFGGEIGGIFVFHPERASAAVRQLEQHPAVRAAERSHFAAFPVLRKWGQYGGLPLDFREIMPGDGILQAQPGDTVEVRYQQPDGSTLELTVTIPNP